MRRSPVKLRHEPLPSRARAGVFLDLENLLFRDRERGCVEAGLQGIVRMLDHIRLRATLVAQVAVCDRSLAKAIAIPLGMLGVRTFTHMGGQDAADLALLRRMESDVPASCDLVVIGSGDHIFTPMAALLKASGRRVEIVAPEGAVAMSLYQVADGYMALHRFSEVEAA